MTLPVESFGLTLKTQREELADEHGRVTFQFPDRKVSYRIVNPKPGRAPRMGRAERCRFERHQKRGRAGFRRALDRAHEEALRREVEQALEELADAGEILRVTMDDGSIGYQSRPPTLAEQMAERRNQARGVR